MSANKVLGFVTLKRAFSAQTVRNLSTYRAHKVPNYRFFGLSDLELKGIKNSDPSNYEDEHIKLVSCETGGEFDHNWSLTEHDIAPYGSSFRNPSIKTLYANSRGKLDKNKALNVQSEEVDIDVRVVGKEEFLKVYESVADYMSDGPNVYCEDACVGGSRSVYIPVRAIANNPVSALFNRHILDRAPLRSADDTRPILAVIAPDYEECGQVALVNIQGATASIVIAGALSSSAVRKAFARAAASILASEFYNSLALFADTHITSKGETVLVFGSPAENLSKKTLYAGHHSIWTNKGITRLWGGVSLAPQTQSQPQDLVLNGTITRTFAADSMISAPTTVLFVDKKEKQINNKDAIKLLGKYAIIGSADEAAMFEQFLEKSKPKCSIITKSELNKILE